MVAAFIVLVVITTASGLAYLIGKAGQDAGYLARPASVRTTVLLLIVALVVGSWFPSAFWALCVNLCLLAVVLCLLAVFVSADARYRGYPPTARVLLAVASAIVFPVVIVVYLKFRRQPGSRSE